MLSLLISSLKMGQNQNGCPNNFQARQGKSAVDNYTILWLPRSYLLQNKPSWNFLKTSMPITEA